MWIRFDCIRIHKIWSIRIPVNKITKSISKQGYELFIIFLGYKLKKYSLGWFVDWVIDCLQERGVERGGGRRRTEDGGKHVQDHLQLFAASRLEEIAFCSLQSTDPEGSVFFIIIGSGNNEYQYLSYYVLLDIDLL